MSRIWSRRVDGRSLLPRSRTRHANCQWQERARRGRWPRCPCSVARLVRPNNNNCLGWLVGWAGTPACRGRRPKTLVIPFAFARVAAGASMSGSGGTADFFYREAQRLGYVARSAFKLIQIQKQHKLIAPGAAVLDLGCAPGAWLQVACQNLGPLEKGGVVIGVDVKKVKVPSAHCDSRVRTVCADVMALMKQQAREMSPQERGFSVILSDMCPVVSGITTKDAALSCELGMRALSLAVGKVKAKDSGCSATLEKFQSSTGPDPDDDGILRRGGGLVIKFLENEDIPGYDRQFIFCILMFLHLTLHQL
ncbi:hypothetical protein GUJ93_ZPchr0003g16797 [Zizania palustris]|uniref:rRNA methyltransferase 2, mitochondrial n=1 Tax=Zizania palustris TaxID=103762 RepID=A0A8J5VX43_ZIZPA|nr:hypothetical protein GUJ93_ZPchr0003g16797 [Zizania palustris]